VTELNWITISSLTFLTIVQHESGVVLWYALLRRVAETDHRAALYAFIVVSVIDLIWLYVLWILTDKSLAGLSHVAWVQRWIDRVKQKRWVRRLSGWFSRPTVPDASTPTRHSRFHRTLRQSGYLGIMLCAALPGPGLKEIGIIMALTPRYRRAGFHVVYVGGLIKTVITMLVYGGLYSVFVRFFS